MSTKDVFVPAFANDSNDALVRALATLEQVKPAHFSAALVSALPEPIFVGDGLAGGIAIGEFIAQEQRDARAAMDALTAELKRQDVAAEVRLLQGQSLTVCDEAAAHGRHADLTVMLRPEITGPDIRREVLEAVLMESGRPVLAIPHGWAPKPVFDTVFIAWNASREAARALGDAEPFLAQARAIVVATVDAKPSFRGHGQAPGMDICAHLARRGYKVDLRNLASAGADRSSALLTAAQEAGADLIVMGGYGHSRLQQSLFGGVTRRLIDTCPVPLFMSH